MLAVLTTLVIFSTPLTLYVAVGSITQFPPGAPPQLIAAHGAQFYVVNLHGELIVFSPITTHGNFPCRIRWIEAYHWFEDPCAGSKFEIDGNTLRVRHRATWIGTNTLPISTAPFASGCGALSEAVPTTKSITVAAFHFPIRTEPGGSDHVVPQSYDYGAM